MPLRRRPLRDRPDRCLHFPSFFFILSGRQSDAIVLSIMKVFFVLLMSILGSAALRAQVDWSVAHRTVGIGPTEIFADSARGRVHVLASGIDADFDGVFTPGGDDVSAAWYVLDTAGNRLDSVIFNGFFNSFPIRVGADLKRGILYAPVNGKVAAYSLTTLKALNDALIDENLAAASFDPASGTLILSARAADFSSPGEIVYFNTQANIVLGRVQAGVNPGNGFVYPRPDIGGLGYYSINEGGFGQTDASITYTTFSADIFRGVNGEGIGGGGADMLADGFRAFVLMGGTHQVRVMETQTHTELPVSPIEIGTEGLDAGRALAISGDTLIVGTYAADVRRFDARTGELIDLIPMPGKVEAVAVMDSLLFAAIHYTAGTYDADSLLVAVNMNTGEPTDTIAVGGLPAALIASPQNDRVIVVGYGAGENPTAWWKALNARTLETVVEGKLPFNLSFPLRTAFVPEENRLMIVGSDTLFSVDVTDADAQPEPIYTDPQAGGELFGVSDGGGYWYVTERPTEFAPAPCYLHAVGKSDRTRKAKFITGGSYLLEALPTPSSADGGSAAYLLHEGNFGATDATLAFADYIPEANKGTMGSGANYAMHAVDEYGTEITAVVMTGSHEVLFLNITEDGYPAIGSRVSTGTTELDGPRQCVIAPCVPVILSNPLLVTAYSGEVILIANDQVMSREAIGGKGEGITKSGDKVYTANSFETGTYTTGTTVSILSLAYSSVDNGNGSEERAGTTLAQNYPNPAAVQTTISFTLADGGDVSLTLYSATGERVATLVNGRLERGRHDLTIGTEELAAGTYIYTLRTGAETLTKKMEVVR